MQENINETIKVLISSGINQKNSNIYIQSNVPEHVQHSWILSNFCQIGELQRMTQFKEKADQLGSHAGILTYPVLMAADILIHKANEVPVGDDQTQHLELTRNIVERFNNSYGEIFPLPERTTGKVGARLMSLRHPDNKMSKSKDDLNGTIYFLNREFRNNLNYANIYDVNNENRELGNNNSERSLSKYWRPVATTQTRYAAAGNTTPATEFIDNNGVELLVSGVSKATTEQFIVNDLAIADNEVKEISGILLGTYQSLYVESTGAVTFTLVGLEEQAEIPS